MSLTEYRTSTPITDIDGATWSVQTSDHDDGVLAVVWIVVGSPGKSTTKLALERDNAERLMVALSSALSATRVYAHEIPETTNPIERKHK